MRTELERRPSLVALIGLIVGLTAPAYGVNLIWLVVGLIVCRPWVARGALVVGFLGGALLAPTPPSPVEAKQQIDAVLAVSSSPTLSRGGGCVFLASSGGRTIEVVSPDLIPVIGDEVQVTGDVKPLPQEREKSYLSRGISGIAAGRSLNVTIVRHVTGPAAWGAQWRESFLGFTRRSLSGDDAAIADALAFDVRTDLSQDTRDALEQSGTVHVLAASGLHVFAIGFFLELMLRYLPIPYLVRQIFILGCLLLYSAASGFHPGTVRAVIASAFRDTSVVAGRGYDALSALAVAGGAYLTWRPAMVYDSGMQLSLVLGAGVAVFRTGERGSDGWRGMTKSAVVGWMTSVPIVAQLFGLVSIVSIPANAIAVVLLPVCLLSLLGAHALSGVWPFGSQVLIAPGIAAAHALGWVVHVFGSAREWGFRVPAFSGYWLVPIYGAALMLWKPRARPAT